MKKIISLIITTALMFSFATASFAKADKSGNMGKKDCQVLKQNHKGKKQVFKIKKSPVIKHGRYKLPINPITKGMGAAVAFDKSTSVLTVTKGETTIVIDFKNKTATVNGVVDTKSDIFTAHDNKKMTVLIKYIASALGIRTVIKGDEIEVEIPNLDIPTNVTVTPVGTTVKANTLNAATLYMTASANIKAGQATGGKAELYVGSRLVATDNEISATDTTVTFTTSDGTPTNAELQAIVPSGGAVTVKLYNAENKHVTSKAANPKLVVDYAAPTLTGVTSVVYDRKANRLHLVAAGAGAVGDKVDVTKLLLTDSTAGKTYQLTDTAGKGSSGVVSGETSLVVSIGSADKIGLADFGASNIFLTISSGSLLTDAAGNVSTAFESTQILPVTVINP